jgi:propanol-preferring alcohol dehydrogenase
LEVGATWAGDIPATPYRVLWEERELVSVANLTRADAEEFFPVAREAGVRTHTKS